MSRISTETGIYSVNDWVVFSVQKDSQKVTGHGRIIKLESELNTAVIFVMRSPKGIHFKVPIQVPLSELKKLIPTNPYKKEVKPKETTTVRTHQSGYGWHGNKLIRLDMSKRSTVFVAGWIWDVGDKCWRPALDDEEENWERWS